jgi:nucleoside 2-deoxyribosyltransferase
MTNNLSGSRCYIARPIEFAKNKNINFTKLEKFLKLNNVKILDPKKIKFHGISEIKDRKKLFKNNNFEEIRSQMKIIVRKDLRCVDISDFIIAFLPKGVRTTGTIHEIIESDRQNKPTLLVCPEGKKYIPAWFFGIIKLEYMFNSIDELIEYLNKINSLKEIIKIDDRWQFIIKDLLEKETNT